MQRICFVLQVRPSDWKNTRRAIAPFWPGMLAALRETGWNNYSLFCVTTGSWLDIGTEDFERARSGMARREVNERWQREMGDLFVQQDGALLVLSSS